MIKTEQNTRKSQEKLKPLRIAGRNIKYHFIKWKTVWCFLKILNIELPYDPAIALGALKSGTETDTCTPNAHSSTTHAALLQFT